jgi:hypothetical protein
VRSVRCGGSGAPGAGGGADRPALSVHACWAPTIQALLAPPARNPHPETAGCSAQWLAAIRRCSCHSPLATVSAANPLAGCTAPPLCVRADPTNSHTFAPRISPSSPAKADASAAAPDGTAAANCGAAAAAAAAGEGCAPGAAAAVFDETAADQVEADLAALEATAFTPLTDLGWLGELALGPCSGDAAAACGVPGLVTCPDCQRVVLRARAGAHAARCFARRRLTERQQQALMLRAAAQQRPSTPPTSNMSKPTLSGRGGGGGGAGSKLHHHHKGGGAVGKRQSSNLGPHRLSLHSPGGAAAPGADGRPPLPRATAGLRAPAAARPASMSPLSFARSAGAGGGAADGGPSLVAHAAGGGSGFGLDELHPALLARAARRPRSATPQRCASLGGGPRCRWAGAGQGLGPQVAWITAHGA